MLPASTMCLIDARTAHRLRRQPHLLDAIASSDRMLRERVEIDDATESFAGMARRRRS